MRKKSDRHTGSSRRTHPSTDRFRHCENKCETIRAYLDYSVRRKV